MTSKLSTKVHRVMPLCSVWTVAKSIASIAANHFQSSKRHQSTTVLCLEKFLVVLAVGSPLPFLRSRASMIASSIRVVVKSNFTARWSHLNSVDSFHDFSHSINRAKRVEADPVSISLAYRSANRAPVDEGNIAYGFKGVPVDQPRRKIVKHVPEEKLYAIDGSIIELKKNARETCEDDDNEEDDEIDTRGHLSPGYAELGYAPVVKPKIAKRRKIHDFQLEPLRKSSSFNNEKSEFEDEDCIFRRGKVVRIDDCDDGYNSQEASSSSDYDA